MTSGEQSSIDKTVHMLFGPSGTGKTEFGNQLSKEGGFLLVGGDEVFDDVRDTAFGRPSRELLYFRNMPHWKRQQTISKLRNPRTGQYFAREVIQFESALLIEHSMFQFGGVVLEPKTVTREMHRGTFDVLRQVSAKNGWVLHVLGYMSQTDDLRAAYERMRARQLAKGGLEELGVQNYSLEDHLRKAAQIEPLSKDEGFEKIFTVAWLSLGKYKVTEVQP